MLMGSMAENSEIPCSPEVIAIEDEETHPDTDKGGKMQCVFTWRIKNFSCCQLDCGEELCSPIFSADSSAKTRWYMSVFPNGQIDYEEFVSVHLIRLPTGNELHNIKLNCKISFFDAESEVWHSEKSEQVLSSLERFQFNNFVKKQQVFEEKSKVLPEDTLTICCQICAYDDSDIVLAAENSIETQNYRHALLKRFSNDLKSIYRTGKFGDVTLKLKDGSILAHKVILSARSPVFARLIRDSLISEIAVPLFEKGTIEALLSYIYTGEIDVVKATSSLELYDAAEKYNVRELKRSITPSKILARTEVIKENFSYTWRLKNFSFIKKNSGRMIYSDKFHTGPSCRLWSLSLYFHNNGNEDGDEDVGIYLNKLWTTDEKKVVYVHFEICLLDKNETPRYTVEMQKSYKQTNRFGFLSFIKRSALLDSSNNLLPGDTLTVRCDMKVGDGTSLSKIEHSHSSTNTNLLEISDVKNLSDCFKELLSNKMDSDVTVCSGKKRFYLHKTILSARSPVFTEFFENLTRDLKPYTIDVSGIRPNVLELLFYFIYTGELEDLSCETAPDLYAAASHYKIADIKVICSNFLKNNLTVSNAFQIMALCKTLDDGDLKNLVKDFICSHADELINSSQWQDFVRNHEDFSTEILTSLADGYRMSKRRRLN